LLLIASLLLAGCATTSPEIDVFLLRLAPVEATLLEQRIRLDVRVQNASEAELSVTGVALQLDINDRRLAKGVSNESFTVPRLGETKTSIEASVTLFDVARLLLDLPGRETFTYEVKGKVYVGGGVRRSIRFAREGEVARADLETLGTGNMRSSIAPKPPQ
jgi:LEA14-like dessication related protein